MVRASLGDEGAGRQDFGVNIEAADACDAYGRQRLRALLLSRRHLVETHPVSLLYFWTRQVGRRRVSARSLAAWQVGFDTSCQNAAPGENNVLPLKFSCAPPLLVILASGCQEYGN